MPWDGATTFRPGTRFGPEAVRSASGMMRTFNTAHRVQVLGAGDERRGALSCIDFGDAPTVPGYVEETLRRIESFVHPIVDAGVIPVGIGGDHTVTLAELRALARRTGPLGLVHIDSHGDLWDDTFGVPYNHGTMFRRAIEEGTLDPARMIQAGIRGPLYVAEDMEIQESLGVELITWLELCELEPSEFAERAGARRGRPDVQGASMSTSSTPPSYREPARRRSGARRRTRPCSTCVRSMGSSSAASTSWRSRPLRRARSDDRAVRCPSRLRDALARRALTSGGS